MMKEAQKSELLTTLRTKSETGQRFIESILSETTGRKIIISGLYFSRKSLEKCKETIVKAKTTDNINDMKKILKEDTIPMGLLYKEKFWKEFQDVIEQLHKI